MPEYLFAEKIGSRKIYFLGFINVQVRFEEPQMS